MRKADKVTIIILAIGLMIAVSHTVGLKQRLAEKTALADSCEEERAATLPDLALAQSDAAYWKRRLESCQVTRTGCFIVLHRRAGRWRAEIDECRGRPL